MRTFPADATDAVGPGFAAALDVPAAAADTGALAAFAGVAAEVLGRALAIQFIVVSRS